MRRRRPSSGRKGSVAPFNLTIHEGEVVGLAGLLGSGRTELARLLFGADRADHGQVRVDGEPAALRTPRAAIGHDIAFCSENRRTEGLVGDLTVRENIILALQAARGWTRPHPAPPPGRAGRQVHQGAAASARPTRSCRCATSPAATSRRCCWPAG